MLSFRRIRHRLFQVFVLGLLLFGLYRETSATTNLSSGVTTEDAGWLAQGDTYKLSGTLVRPNKVNVSQINVSITAIPVADTEGGQTWLLPEEISWDADTECFPSQSLVCAGWQATLDTSTLPIGDYNLVVSMAFDRIHNIVDVFGDTDDERCNFNCPDEGMPTCNGGLCQYGGTDPEVRLVPASPALYAIAPAQEVS